MSIQDPAVERRLVRMHRLEEANPERFCWANLVWSSFHPAADGDNLHHAESLGDCRQDAEDNGHCYCGKWEFADGEMRLSKREEA